MKKTLLKITTLAFIMLLSLNGLAQLPLGTATLGITLQCTGGTDNRAGIAYNPNQQLYYSINAGSGAFPIETFSITGVRLDSNSSGYSYRGLWWNPNDSTLEGKTHNAGGIVRQYLDTNFYPLGTGITIVAGSGPETQSCGDYDWIDDEVLYYYSGSIYRYDRTTHTQISSAAITGLPVPTTNLNSNTAAYTNVAGMEAGVYDGVNKVFYFINKNTGAYVDSCQLPLTAPTATIYQMGFEKGYLWLYNITTSQWEGYQTVDCSSTDTITETACYTYTSPSGNYIWTTSGTYLDTISNVAGCDSVITINLTIDTVDLSVSQLGEVLTANATGASYQWLNCDSAYSVISGATNQVFTATANGNYAVVVTENTCIDTSLCYNVNNIGISELNKTDVSIYPNPTNNKVTVDLGNYSGTVQYTVFSIEGKLIEEQTTNENKILINLSKEKKGVYLLRIIDAESSITYKIIKE